MTIQRIPFTSRALAGVLLVAALAVGGWLLFGTRSSDAASSASPDEWKLGKYSLFDQQAKAVDNIAGWRQQDEPRLGTRFAEAKIVFKDDTRTVAAVPATDGPCLVTQYTDGSGGMVCDGPDHITAGLGYNGAIGLVPDGVDTVTYTMADGTTQVQKVEGNVWHSPVDAAQVEFTLQGQDTKLALMARSSLPEGAVLQPNGVVTGAGGYPAGDQP